MLCGEMVQLSDFSLLVEGSPAFPRSLVEPVPPIPDFDLEMPRVFRRPSPPPLPAPRRSVRQLLEQARKTQREGNAAGFGKTYGALSGEFKSDIQWALSCWEFLLSTQGCRFVARNSHEKLYARGDYRVFTWSDFEGLAYRSFRECLLLFLSQSPQPRFERFLRERFWASISEGYRLLEEPADRNQRKLTPYSYLRCIPYRFLNPTHQERVYRTVNRLPFKLRQPVQLFWLSFYREEAASERSGVPPEEFRRRRWAALRAVASEDYLSFRLLRQIERY